jgi:hypothetical protein
MRLGFADGLRSSSGAIHAPCTDNCGQGLQGRGDSAVQGLLGRTIRIHVRAAMSGSSSLLQA